VVVPAERLTGDRLGELGSFLYEGEQVVDEGAVSAEQVLDPGDVQPCLLGQPVPGSSRGGLVALGAEERDVLGAGRRDPLVEAVGSGVDGVLGHDAVRRVLPARDHGEPGDGRGDGVFAAEPAGGL
jgi:hypothetical protein